MSLTVLMFGWEFPPHISGGLGTACYGLTKALIREGTKILFVVPKAYGDEAVPLINASDVFCATPDSSVETSNDSVAFSGEMLKIDVSSQLVPYTDPAGLGCEGSITQWNYQFESGKKRAIGTQEDKRYSFSGTYGPALFDEVMKYSEVGGIMAAQLSFDVIHAHDWLTYPAGIEAKRASGKPLIVHVHATEYDRAAEKHINSKILEIEKRGMFEADRIVAVSHWTKDIIVSRYQIAPDKVEVVHNGVIQVKQDQALSLPKIGDQVVTFLGRITWQKGPQYFVESAWKVLHYFPATHFIMAGSGDLLPKMIEMVAELNMSDRFHFTGFLKGDQVDKVWSVSDVYVMPSVSEPFGITPLEALQANVPIIVSKQSGVAEVVDHAIKLDFWDTDSLADAIMNILRHKSLSAALRRNGRKELRSISWRAAASKINRVYHELKEQVSAIH
jgi:glycogen synthase